jgi:hypothetical protein
MKYIFIREIIKKICKYVKKKWVKDMLQDQNIQLEQFRDIDLDDLFFDSLKETIKNLMFGLKGKR